MTTTAEEMQSAISDIIEKRSASASQSQYDRMVCVSEARRVFDGIPVQETADQCSEAVLSAIGKAQDDYYHSDGECTSGKSLIGDVYLDISLLLKERRGPLKASCT